MLSRVVALNLVAATSPAEFSSRALGDVRNALLEERWDDALVGWIEATGVAVDAYPDEPIWTEDDLDPDRANLELLLAPIFAAAAPPES